jgi:hypothetical protein
MCMLGAVHDDSAYEKYTRDAAMQHKLNGASDICRQENSTKRT